jgi:putative heme-binding domain-containing protein
MIAHPNDENAIAVLMRMGKLMDEFVSDRNFTDLLRVAQLALHRSQVQPDQTQWLAEKLGNEFPSSDATINRELIRLLAYLQVASPMDRYLAYLTSDADDAEKLHLGLHLRYITGGWGDGQRLSVIRFYEDMKQRTGGPGYRGYISNVERDFARSLTPAEGRQVLSRGAQWPAAATGALYGLPKDLDRATFTVLQQLDKKLANSTDESAAMLRLGIVAVMARSGTDEAFAHLREMWDNEPERREKVAMGLAQRPDGANWEYLVRSLPILDGDPAIEVLTRLQSVPKTSDDPEHLRQIILCGLRVGDQGVPATVGLLQHWTGEKLLSETATPAELIQAWQNWYADQFPEKPRAELPVASSESKWKFDDLLAHLTSPEGSQGSPAKGAIVFEKAQCAKCHRFGSQGENIGPDLTSLSKRFMKKEVLESIVYPSHIISDQYASKTVVTASGRSYTGVVGPGSNGEKIVLQNNGKKVAVKERDIDEIVPSQKSIMPDNLLDPLTLEEISDLCAYLGVVPSIKVVERSTVEERSRAERPGSRVRK